MKRKIHSLLNKNSEQKGSNSVYTAAFVTFAEHLQCQELLCTLYRSTNVIMDAFFKSCDSFKLYFQIQFAKNVILPSDDDKEQNENAFHRRQLIKYRSANRRTSLLDNVTMAMDVLNGNIETAV